MKKSNPQKKWNQVIAYWNQYISRNPDNSHAYIERGGAYYRKGDLKMAVQNAKIAADMGDPEGKRLYNRFKDRVK